MQQPGNNRRGRSKRRRGGNGERQPLTNESTIGLQTKKRSKKANYRVPPSAVDPNYVPGKNPQYADLDEGDGEGSRKRDGQPRHNGNGVVQGKTSQGEDRQGRRRKRSSGSRNNRSGQPKTTDPQGRATSTDERRTKGRPGKNQKGKGQQQPQRGKNKRRGKGLGMAKKAQSREQGRSKVYTSDMFIYKENLVPDKPVERKMRSRRNKPSDDPPSES